MHPQIRSFAVEMAKAFELAPLDAPYEYNMRTGPFIIRFGFSSPALAATYMKSLLPEPAGAPDLRVRVLAPDDIDLRRLIPLPAEQGRAFSHGRYFSLWHPDRLPLLYLLDREHRRALVWLSAGAAPEWELSRPACPLIHAFIADTPWAIIHGAAIGRDGRTLLLAGKGRAGKSTAALSCAVAGWDYAGDDYVLAETSTGLIAPVYTSARLRVDMASAFADILHCGYALSFDEGDPRHELRLGDYLDAGRLKGGRLAAFLLPRRAGALRCEFQPARRADALNALFKITMMAMPASLRQTATKLGSLISLAPAFFVDTGTDPRTIPDAFGRFLEQV